jgi:hypothetical protein
VYIYDAGRESGAGLFAAMASGRATPIEYHHGDFLAQSLTKARTKSDDRRAIAFLSAWCDQTSTPATLEAITRKEALRFHDALPKLPGARRLRLPWERVHPPWAQPPIAQPVSKSPKSSQFSPLNVISCIWRIGL